MPDLKVLLISTYELGRQPFGLASPAAWLRADGFHTTSLDLSRQSLDEEAVRTASLIAFYLPMHTATRIAVRVLARVRKLNSSAHLCGFGLYAPVNAGLLRRLGVGTILGGEFEQGLLSLVRRLKADAPGPRLPQVEPEISLARQNFLVPYRDDLPPLEEYAHLTLLIRGFCASIRTSTGRSLRRSGSPPSAGPFDLTEGCIARQLSCGAYHRLLRRPNQLKCKVGSGAV
jgi:hypothetical protein